MLDPWSRLRIQAYMAMLLIANLAPWNSCINFFMNELSWMHAGRRDMRKITMGAIVFKHDLMIMTHHYFVNTYHLFLNLFSFSIYHHYFLSSKQAIWSHKVCIPAIYLSYTCWWLILSQPRRQDYPKNIHSLIKNFEFDMH